jgi:hypothetical protein
MRYVYKGSFVQPVGRPQYVDGRDRCDRALKKLFAAGPTTPADLFKRDRSDASVHLAIAKKLSRQERLRGSNSAEALEQVKKLHRAGGRRSLDEAEGDAPLISKSVTAMERARQHVVSMTGHSLPSAIELNKLFANRSGKRTVHLDEVELPLRKRELSELHAAGHRLVTAGRYEYEFDAKGIVVSKSLRKGLTTARPRLNDTNVHDNYNHGAPESLNGTWTDTHADTRAANNWRDIPVPSERPTVVGSQNTVTPNTTDRDAAVAAIKRALRKPQKMWGNAEDRDEDQDQTSDLDEDDADEDEDESRIKNPNADDAVGTRSRKRKSRADEDEDEDEDDDE